MISFLRGMLAGSRRSHMKKKSYSKVKVSDQASFLSNIHDLSLYIPTYAACIYCCSVHGRLGFLFPGKIMRFLARFRSLMGFFFFFFISPSTISLLPEVANLR